MSKSLLFCRTAVISERCFLPVQNYSSNLICYWNCYAVSQLFCSHFNLPAVIRSPAVAGAGTDDQPCVPLAVCIIIKQSGFQSGAFPVVL